MRPNTRKQLVVLGVFLAIYALLALVTYAVIPEDQLAPPGQSVPTSTSTMPRWHIAVVASAGIFVIYGLLGLAGYWFARKLDLPAVYGEGAGWRALFLSPMLLGLGMGVVLVIVGQIVASIGSAKGFPHPAFPFSLIASATAGIGEEILFRAFVMGLWAFLLNLVLRRWNGRTAALWIGNGIAALAFSASHLPAVMILLNMASPAAIPALTLAKLVVLNSGIGLVAGQRYMRDGLVAAVEVHFWADIVWHVIWPLLGPGA